MALLPKYQKTGIRVRQASSMDFAAERERQRQSGVISQQLERMGKFAFERGAEMAERRGQERVREQGAVATLEQMQERGGVPFTIEQKAAYEAANRVAVVEIETAARSDMRELITQADQSNMSMAQFNEKMSDIRDGYSASLQLVDPVAAGVLSARLQEDSATFDSRYSEIVTRKAKAAWAANTEIALNEGVQTVVDTALREGVTAKEIKAAGEKLRTTALTRGVNEKKAQKLVDKAVNAALRENLIYRFNEAAGIKERQALLAELEQSDTFAGMNYEGSFNFKSKLANAIDREIENGRNSYIAEAENAQIVMSHTGQFPEGFDAASEDAEVFFEGDEETLELINRSLEYSQQDAVTYGTIATMSPEEVVNAQSAMAEDLEEAKARGESGAEIQALTKRLNDFQNVLSDRADRIDADPALYVIQTNKEAALAANKTIQALGAGDIEAVGEHLKALSIELNDAYDSIGVSPIGRKIMSKSMAASMVTAIQRINTDFEVAVIKQVQDSLGPIAPQFIHEMRSAGLQNEYYEALQLDDVATHTLLATIAPIDIATITPKTTEKTVVDDKIEELTDNYYIASVRGRGEVTVNDLDNQMEVVKKLAYYFVNEGADPVKAAESAVTKVIPQYNNVATLDGGKNGQFVVPKNLNADRMQLFAAGILKPSKLEELGVVALDVSIAGTEEDQRISYLSLAKNGVWLNNDMGDGVVLHYAIDDRTLIQATYEDGSAVDIKFKDLPTVSGPQRTTVQKIIDPVKLAIPGATTAAQIISGAVSGGTATPLGKGSAREQAEIQTSKANQISTLLEPMFKSDQGTQVQQNEYRGYLMTWMQDPSRASDDVLSYEDWLKTQE